MKRLEKILRFVFGRNWVLPVVAVLAGLVCVVACGVLAEAGFDAPVAYRHALSLGMEWAIAILILLIPGLLLWLLVLTVLRLIKRQHRVWWAWLWTAVAELVLVPCAAVSVFFCALGNYDMDYTPLGMEMAPERNPDIAVPVGFSFFDPPGGELPPVARAWKERVEVDKSLSVSADEALSESAPHVEKLAADAPLLLLEYKLRAICHQALTPGVKVAPQLHMLRHPQGHNLAAEVRRWPVGEDDAEWRKPLPNQWEIYDVCTRWNDKPAPTLIQLKKLQLLNEGLAPLAENPTREGLDALLPPLPDKPTLVLREDFQPGMYRILLVVPSDYPEGSFHVTVREHSRGSAIETRDLDSIRLTPEPYHGFCKLAESDDFMIFSGEWGEIYAAVWELHFTPAGSSESRCVNSQVYLTQGWSR